MQRRKVRRLKKRFRYLLVVMVLFLMLPTVFTFFKSNKIENSTKEFFNFNLKPNYTEESVFPENVFGIPVYNKMIAEGSSRTTKKRIIKYIVIHETDNEEIGAGAHNHSDFLSSNNTSPTSWHYTVDDHEIYHHIPDNEVANHAGDSIGNEYGIGIELCVNKDGNFNKTFENGAKLVAFLLKSYQLSIEDIKTHHDFSGKDCPHRILKSNRLEEFKEKVNVYLEDE